MKRFKKQISLLLAVALVVSSLVIGFGTIKVSAVDQATGQLATYQFHVKTAAQDCNGTGTANSLVVKINYLDGTNATANTIAGESTPNYFEAGNTDQITLSPQLPAKPISSINFVSSGGDRWKVDWVNFYYSPDSGSTWLKIGTFGGFDEGSPNKNFTYPSDYSLNTSSLNKTLTFNANGGTGGKQIYSEYGATLPAGNIPTVTRTGYTFTGWAPAVPSTGPSVDTTYTAQWTPITITVSFNANGGTTPVPTSKIVIYGSTYGNLASTSRIGYIFIGWYTSGGTQVTSTTIVTATSDHSLYAHWAAITYTIVYDGNGASGGSTPPSTHTYDEPKPLSMNGFYKTGYTFQGWSTTPGGPLAYTGGDSVTNLASFQGATVTLYARWTPYTYTVIFDSNGATGGSMSSINCSYDLPVILPPNELYRIGYTFIGWTTSPNGSVMYIDGEQILNLSPINGGTVTLYPVWQANQYEVIYNANGGTGTMANTFCTYDVVGYLRNNSFTKTGYTLAGWATSAGGAVVYANQASVMNLATSGSVTLYAKWTPITYTVVYNGNGATGGSMPSTPCTYDVSRQPPVNGFSKTGNTFTGWNTAADGSGTAITNVFNLTATQGATITLFAQWSPNYICITFDANGGTGGTSICGYYGMPITAPVVSRPGYTLIEWSPAVPPLITESMTFTAQWAVCSYIITFDANGGTGGTSMLVNYGVVPTPPTVTRTGYTFTGWESSPIVAVTGEATYTAQWTVNNYLITFDANGGMGGTGPTAMPYGSPLSAPTVTKTGYDFTGWTPSVPATVPAEETTYVAQWTLHYPTLTFKPNGGTWWDGTTGDKIVSTGGYGYNFEAPGALTRVGYDFAGWSPALPSTVPTTDETYIAQWNIKYICITFDAGGGTGGTSICGYYGMPINPPPSVTRTGYTFIGWSPAVPPTAITENMTFTAQWMINSYTITWDANGGTGGGQNACDYGSTPTEIDAGTKAGYTFNGWEPEIVPVTGDATYTAQWVSIPPFLDIEYDPPFFIDPSDRFIFGLPEGTTLEEFENMCAGIIDGNGTLEITTLQGEFGTGTKVELIDNANEEVVGSWRIVIFGDVNGDGNVGAVDADIINNYENYLIEWDPEAEDYLFFAGDVNGDRFIGAVDADIINNCENYIMWIDQWTGLAYAE